MLEVRGQIDVACTLDRAWGLFTRFGDLAALIPTVEEVEVDGDRVHARVGTRLGVLPISSRVVLEVVERQPYACLKATGVSYLGETIREQIAPGKSIRDIETGSVGRLNLHLDLRATDDRTRIAIIYHAEVEAEGRLKRIYQSILTSKAPAMMEAFAENVRAALEKPEEPAPLPVEVEVEVEVEPEPIPPIAPLAPIALAARPAGLGIWARLGALIQQWLRRLGWLR